MSISHIPCPPIKDTVLHLVGCDGHTSIQHLKPQIYWACVCDCMQCVTVALACVVMLCTSDQKGNKHTQMQTGVQNPNKTHLQHMRYIKICQPDAFHKPFALQLCQPQRCIYTRGRGFRPLASTPDLRIAGSKCKICT